MQLFAYRNTEAGARFNLTPTEKPMTIRELRELRAREDGFDLAAYARDAAQDRLKREADEALRRGRAAARKFNQSCKSLEDIVRVISKATGVSRLEILQDRRHKQIVFARQAVCYWAHRLTTLSYPEIGRRLGNRDHTTIMHSARVYALKRAQMGRYVREPR